MRDPLNVPHCKEKFPTFNLRLSCLLHLGGVGVGVGVMLSYFVWH
jgi:hypothetical protein